MTYTDHINQETGIMIPLPMCPRWHQFQSSNFKKTHNVQTMSESGMFRSLHSILFTDGHTMQFTVVPLVTVHNFACTLGCSCFYQGLLLYFFEELIFMFTLILLNLSVTHNISFSPCQIFLQSVTSKWCFVHNLLVYSWSPYITSTYSPVNKKCVQLSIVPAKGLMISDLQHMLN